MSENGTCLTSGNPPTPHMTRTAFLQTGGQMAITVTGLTVSETYRIGFVMARRGNYNAHLARTFTVTMGGQNLGVYSPMTTTWEQALTGAVVANARSLQLVLEAGAEPGNDSMALIDDVAVMPAHPHAARAMGNGNSFEYDANGNMTIRREKLDGISYVYTQTWTIDNRLASVIKFDVTGTIQATTTIAYDGDGVRVKKMDPSGATYYLGMVEVLVAGTTQVTTSYYAFGGAMVAMRTAATATLTYLHGDHLGSTSLTTNASGQKVSEQRYKPYGEVRWTSGAGMPTDKQFTSQSRLEEGYVGTLYDYVARAYDPVLGRFISADTIVPGAGNPQAFNRYAYVSGRPLNLVDPTGNCGNAPGQTPCPIEEMVKDSLTCRMDQGSTNSTSIGPVSASTVVQGPSSSPDLSDKWMVDSGTYGLTFGPLVSAVGAGFIGVATEAASGVSAAARVAATAYQVVRAAQDVWKMRPFDRGQAIEDLLGRSPNLARNFPGIDRFTNGVATSIKSIDLGAKTYQETAALASKIQGYVNEVASWPGARWGGVTVRPEMISARELILAIPPGASVSAFKTLELLRQWAQSIGISLSVVIVK